ncbi:MAG: TraB/GumN family protein, partial [Candidatus Nanohaloarchaea archaeon]
MIERVSLDGKEIVLVGTAHVSRESREEVSRVIEEEEPDTVCVELDEKRYESLKNEAGWKGKDVAEALEEGKGFLLLLNVLMSIYQRKIGESLQVDPGSEMLEAVEAAERIGAGHRLIDRDISDTMRSAVEGLTLREKTRLVFQTFSSFFRGEEVTEDDLEELKDEDVLKAVVEELGGDFPSLKTAFLDERDAYMAERIRELDADKVVAVVGAAHLEGVRRRLEEGSEEKVPGPVRKSHVPWTKIVSYGVPIAIVGMFVYVFAFVGFEAGKEAFLFWFLINGILAGLGSIVSRAHPLTTVTAFLAAPFASVNPAVPTGLVAAYTENRLRPPKVGDLEEVGSISEFGEF